MNNPLLSRTTGRFLLAFACIATALATAARAQTDATVSMAVPDQHEAVRLDNYVVSASRTPQDPRFTPSAVSVLLPGDLAQAQVTDLRTALAAQPGVAIVSSGAAGSQTSIFMRGANSDQVLFFVDGVRMNTADAGYANFLGGADLAGIDRLEVLRGPQSTLYGSSALGGVILVDTTRGCGKLQGVVRASFGSFDTFGGLVSVEGGTKTLGYSASLANSNTDNERTENSYKQTSYSSRLEWTATPELLVGMTLRGQVGKYEEAGPLPLGYSSQGTVEAPNHLVTTYAQWGHADDFCSRLTVAWHQTEYQWTDKTYGAFSDFYYRNTREVADWQNSWQAAPWVQLLAGANAEWSRYTSHSSSGGQALDDRQHGLYASSSFHFLESFTFDLGGRTDDYDLAGRADTWRTGLAYRINDFGTKLRATYGTGFKAPSMTSRFGLPPYVAPNPSLKPEKSQGWDVGFDQEIAHGVMTVSATYFQNRFRDLINYSSGMYSNVSSAETTGTELALTAQPVSSVKLRASYTYLSALDTSNSQATFRLIRRPRHTGDFDAQWQATAAWMIGSGLHFVSDRLASSSATVSVRTEDYTTVRIYSSYVINEAVTVKLRVENALDEKYSEVPGYAALSRSVFGSVDWKF